MALVANLFGCGADDCATGCGMEACAPDGAMPFGAQPCCSSERDANGKCCSGSACESHETCLFDGINPTGEQLCCNGQRAPDGKCCSGSSCAPTAGRADLVLEGFDVQPFAPSSGRDSFYICVNQDPVGTPQNYGNFIWVKNLGPIDAGPYETALGIVRENQPSQYFLCPQRLSATGTKAGADIVGRGPYCCGFNLLGVPSGNYHIFVSVDPDDRIPENDHGNNTVVTIATLSIP